MASSLITFELVVDIFCIPLAGLGVDLIKLGEIIIFLIGTALPLFCEDLESITLLPKAPTDV